MDTDSYEMRVDTGASYCISYDREDFSGTLSPIRGSIQGYHDSGSRNKLYMGTLKFKITDDDGETHDFEVPNSVYDAQG